MRLGEFPFTVGNMPTREVPPPDVTVEDLVAAAKQRLKDLERSTSWLARRIGVSDSTLRYWLDDRPDLLRVTVWLSILDALGITWDDVVAVRAA